MLDGTARGALMTTRPLSDEDEIRGRIAALAEAVCAMDLERVMSFYAPDIVSFDIVPPLRHVRADAKRRNWVNAFAEYERPLSYALRDLAVCVGPNVAFAHSLNRMSGTLKNGRATDVWVRWTACFRRIDGPWLIAHDHVSVPADLESGRALLDLHA
jgi:ketosteroid isomerase-like protein